MTTLYVYPDTDPGQVTRIVDDAEIAVSRLGGMHEHGRGAGGAERGGKLVGDVTGLADAGGDDLPVAAQHDLHRPDEIFIHVNGTDGLGLGFQDGTHACFDVHRLTSSCGVASLCA